MRRILAATLCLATTALSQGLSNLEEVSFPGVDVTALLKPAQFNQIATAFGDRTVSLTRLYVSDGMNCDGAAWHAFVDDSPHTLTVAKSKTG